VARENKFFFGWKKEEVTIDKMGKTGKIGTEKQDYVCTYAICMYCEIIIKGDSGKDKMIMLLGAK
jgi:hypothetical protein